MSIDLRQIFRALAFAAEKHRRQRRKDTDASPYINHPVAVAHVLAVEASVSDVPTLVAAILHDTVEDTETTAEELAQQFGPEIAALVTELTDDKSLPKQARKQLQIARAAAASPQAKRLKLADKICNVRDVTANPPLGWSRERRLEYLEWAVRVAAGCRGVDPALDALFDATLRRGREALCAEP